METKKTDFFEAVHQTCVDVPRRYVHFTLPRSSVIDLILSEAYVTSL